MTMQQTALAPQQEMLNRRLPWVIGFLLLLSGGLVFAVAQFQLLSPEVEREVLLRGEANVRSIRRLPAQRGIIYDRDGYPLAFNQIQYDVGVSPDLVTDARGLATQLGAILSQDEFLIYQRITSNNRWVRIARPVSASQGQQVSELDNIAIRIDPLSERFYPQGFLAAPLIGFVIPDDDDNKRGAMGVESEYNNQLSGRVIDQEFSNIPFDVPDLNAGRDLRRGMDVVLTIDRDIQFWAENELQRALDASGASSGNVIVMDPHNGEILAMVSLPTFDPNEFSDYPEFVLGNTAISEVYEPGSVFKALTLAAALEKGVITSDWSYNDQGIIEVGGYPIQNWDGDAYGVMFAGDVLTYSLNIGATEIALDMGPDLFYDMMRNFGVGQLTRIDLPGEEAGIMKVKGLDPEWSESDLATNSFGQGIAVTPIQMTTAIAAIANDGLMMQPRIVKQLVNGDDVIDAEPAVLRRAVSAETAQTVAQMMVRVVEEGATRARLEGYNVAGKTGTAEIPNAVDYETGPNSTITSFVGFLPADDPQVVVMVKLNRPDTLYASLVAAPVFRDLVERLVILLGIPNDETRTQLVAAGGRVASP